MSTNAKDLRNPLKRARGLGSSQFGVGHWWTQRVTAVALIVLVLWFVTLVLGLLHADYATARAAVAKPWNAVLLIAFVITVFWHAVLGLQVVIEDYVHTRWKEIVLLVAIKFIAVLSVLASTLAVLRIALGA
ncbi:succinate dehydrogenase, hydrophobic membrane anchor protein [Dyella caseinilytica]|uniref:Succinate dehydrogenase hydrophobic membrane anchor subunit n=1 Tax=Dyella caseinilytica TaxID=1849581 RepID=A0ABX7GX59_9GAMM|nr:succinate dehydrogenase, hydrophobic membrane anchor protein [Dyella caseinilytica]QRN55007.1 succinate dehydrogenase, hydrophobic membrane anchor protein [Dyella caseinilytica]GFZ98627.1 succinate dehydrogenase membrane anchor subunit [Dyella caseinilytica]